MPIEFYDSKTSSYLVRLSNGTNSDTTLSKPRLVPWNVPWLRRQQTFAILIVLSISFIMIFLNPICILNYYLWPFYLAYLFYISRDTAPENGSRPISWWRNLSVWKWYADYFPSRLINEVDLNPGRKFIFGYHPHGIISTGVLTNFCTNATGIERIFPNINIRPLTLDVIFKIPFFRELALISGVASASKRSIQNILAKGPGNACLIVVGGAEETLEAKPDRANLKLEERRGFVKLALECGADLVPVFGFGENQLYTQIDNSPGSWLHFLQQEIKRLTTLPAPICHGRGVFNYVFGALPYRVPLTVVTGAPIRVEQCTNPTEDQVKELHERYKVALLDLYDRNKGTYWIGSDPPDLKFY